MLFYSILLYIHTAIKLAFAFVAHGAHGWIVEWLVLLKKESLWVEEIVFEKFMLQHKKALLLNFWLVGKSIWWYKIWRVQMCHHWQS